MADLISSAHNSGESWLADMIKIYGPMVKYVICMYIKDEHIAEEAVSDVFIKLSRNRDKLANLAPSEMLPYIYVIARNTRIDYQRKLMRNSNVSYVEPEELDGYPSEFDLWKEIGDAAIGYDVDTYIDRLDPEDQYIIWLSYQKELEDKYIARILGMKEETAKKRRQRALKKIRDLLKGRG